MLGVRVSQPVLGDLPKRGSFYRRNATICSASTRTSSPSRVGTLFAAGLRLAPGDEVPEDHEQSGCDKDGFGAEVLRKPSANGASREKSDVLRGVVNSQRESFALSGGKSRNESGEGCFQHVEAREKEREEERDLPDGMHQVGEEPEGGGHEKDRPTNESRDVLRAFGPTDGRHHQCKTENFE